MSENNSTNQSSAAGFFYRHRKAIVTTVVAVSTAASAYYIYKNLQSIEKSGNNKNNDDTDEDGSSSSSSSTSTTAAAAAAAAATTTATSSITKSKKKRDKKKKKKLEEEKQQKDSTSNLKKKYPILDNGEPDIEKIKTLDSKEQEDITLALKEIGNEQFKSKDFDEALKFYHYALSIKEDPVFYSNISACFVSLNDLDKVIEYCNKALQLKPDYSKVLLRRASAYEQKGNFEDAMFDLSVLSLNNDFSGASIEPILERNLNKQALKKLTEMITEQSDNNTTSKDKSLPSDTSLASFFNMLIPPELEFDHFDESSDADISLKTALNALYKFTHSGFEVASNEFPKSVIAYKDLLRDFDKDQNENGNGNGNGNETGNEQKKILQQKLAIALEYNGILNFMKNDIVTAQDNLNESIELYPRVNANIFMAMILADKWATSVMRGAASAVVSGGESDEPIDNESLKQQYLAKFDDALALDPDNSIAYYHRGQISFIAQDYVSARKDFTKAIELNPNNVFPYIQLACLSYRENNYPECERQFNEARQKFPLAPEIPTFFAELLTDKNDLEQALKQYDIAIKLEEAIAEKEGGKIHVGVAPLIGKATILARQQPVAPENFQLAVDLFQTAVDKDPRNDQAMVGLAQLKLQQEDVDTSIELFEKAARLTRTHEEKLQAITFAEAAKIQKRIRVDPVISKRVEEALAQYRAQGLI